MIRQIKILILLLWAQSAWSAGEASYTLPQLETLALSSSPAVQAMRDQVEAARYGVNVAAAFPNTELEYLGGNARPRAGSTSGSVSSASLTQPLDLPWQRMPRIAVAEAGLESSLAHERAFRAEAIARLRFRFYEMLRREAELKNATEDRQLLDSVRARIAKRVETGEAAKFELIKADAESLNAAKLVQAAAVRVEQSRSLLSQAVGVPLPAGFGISGSLSAVPGIPAREALLAGLKSGSAELARARSEMVRAQRQLDLERALRWPGVAVKATQERDTDFNTSQVGVVVTVPLWDRRSGRIGEAAAQWSRARNEYEALGFSLGQSLETAVQQYEIAQTQVTALESGIVTQTEAALKVAEAAYRFGERGFLEVLDAQRVYRAARSELIAARFELAAAWVEVERLLAAPKGQ